MEGFEFNLVRKEYIMGLIYADLELVSADDIAFQRKGYIKKEDIKMIIVSALVDSGAYMMCINEHIKAQLDLPVVDRMEAELADGTIRNVDVVGPLVINFKNRTTSCNAAVLPGESEVLLGSILRLHRRAANLFATSPMEDMDVVLMPKLQTIDVNPKSKYVAKKRIK